LPGKPGSGSGSGQRRIDHPSLSRPDTDLPAGLAVRRGRAHGVECPGQGSTGSLTPVGAAGQDCDRLNAPLRNGLDRRTAAKPFRESTKTRRQSYRRGEGRRHPALVDNRTYRLPTPARQSPDGCTGLPPVPGRILFDLADIAHAKGHLSGCVLLTEKSAAMHQDRISHRLRGSLPGSALWAYPVPGSFRASQISVI
jgi:hypothetical protein